jgi:septum site-determining protein MinC
MEHSDRQPLRLCGKSYMAFLLAPEPPIYDWLARIDMWAAQLTGGNPVVLDLSGVKLSHTAILRLIEELEARRLRVMGLEGIDEHEIGPDLPPLLKNGHSKKSPRGLGDETVPGQNEEPQSLLLESPVRSGQSIVFPHGDVTVLGSVASGAEVIAGGSIHIYGTLRGRAFAGFGGNSRARIFCSKIEAELLAIDACYRLADDIESSLRRHPIQAWLKGGEMFITPLN